MEANIKIDIKAMCPAKMAFKTNNTISHDKHCQDHALKLGCLHMESKNTCKKSRQCVARRLSNKYYMQARQPHAVCSKALAHTHTVTKTHHATPIACIEVSQLQLFTQGDMVVASAGLHKVCFACKAKTTHHSIDSLHIVRG